MRMIPPLTMLLGRVNVWGANVGISSATEHYRPTVHYGRARGEGICVVRGEGEAEGTVDVTGGERGEPPSVVCNSNSAAPHRYTSFPLTDGVMPLYCMYH